MIKKQMDNYLIRVLRKVLNLSGDPFLSPEEEEAMQELYDKLVADRRAKGMNPFTGEDDDKEALQSHSITFQLSP
ncbi:MAG: hypothetical protein V3V92_02610 [Candidatus Hydrothermarchaeales archaeon]